MCHLSCHVKWWWVWPLTALVSNKPQHFRCLNDILTPRAVDQLVLYTGTCLLPYFISIRFNNLDLKCHYFNKQATLIHYWCQKCTREVPAEVRSPAFLHCRSLLWCHQTVATAWWQCSHSQFPGALLFPGWILNVVTFKMFSFLALLQYIATFNRIILNPFPHVLQIRNASGLPLVPQPSSLPPPPARQTQVDCKTASSKSNII